MTREAPRRLVVIEANEVPRRVLEDHISREPSSMLARLIEQGELVETEVTETLHRTLYPSQTWYSMNSGVPYEKHQVFWYGDPKPDEYPLYWQLAARAGRSVGVVNTLHSSPLTERCSEGDYRFVIPDCFADEPTTLPARYEGFQKLNTELTSSSGRNARIELRPRLAVTGASLPLLGVRPGTMARLAAMAGGIASKRVNKERLRTAQSMLLGDMFLRLGRRHDPDLAVYFTNHVASAMHRYWYAAFPGDWQSRHYSDEWVQRYQDEIPSAMRALDRFVAGVWRWCEATDRVMVMVSSMGQCAQPALDTSTTGAAVVRDPVAFGRALGFGNDVTVSSAMVPQIHYRFATDSQASREADRLAGLDLASSRLLVEQSGPVLTVSYHLGDLSNGELTVDGVAKPLAECGIAWERVDNHRSGTHDPIGVMLIADPVARQVSIPKRVDALDVAPILLSSLGVETPDTMREPVGSL